MFRIFVFSNKLRFYTLFVQRIPLVPILVIVSMCLNSSFIVLKLEYYHYFTKKYVTEEDILLILLSKFQLSYS